MSQPDWVARLTPYIRARVYQISDEGEIDLGGNIVVHGSKCEESHIFDDGTTRVLLCVRYQSPAWSSDEQHQRSSYELIILYWHQKTRLLFINSTVKNDTHFNSIAQAIVKDAIPKPVPMYKLQRVFFNADNARFVNVGMRNGAVGNSSEAYRMLTGPNAHLAVTRTDARTHIKGHAFAQGSFEEGITSLGFTDSGKIWSQNKATGVEELVEQLRKLAEKIQGNGIFESNSELDALSPGEELSHIPDDIIAVSWHERMYQRNLSLCGHHLIDWDLTVNRGEREDKQSIGIILSYDDTEYRVIYSVEPPHFATSNGQPIELDDNRNLTEILNEYPLKFYTAQQSLIMGAQIFHLQSNLPPIDPSDFDVRDWTGINIRREYGEPDNRLTPDTIHGYIYNQLCQKSPDILFYDHDTGEIADFVAMFRCEEQVKIQLYHAKKAASDSPGRDITQLYDVTGQAVKSVRWLKYQFIFDRLKQRHEQKTERLCIGDLEDFTTTFDEHPLPLSFEVIIVQPGISQEKLEPNTDETRAVKELLAATKDYIQRAGDATLYIWSSS